MSWRPGRSGSFRRSGIHLDGSSFRLSSSRNQSDDDSADPPKPSTTSTARSFLRMRPSSGNSSDGGQSSSNGTSNHRSSETGFVSLPLSRGSSFRSHRDSLGSSTLERLTSCRRSAVPSPSPASALQKPFGETTEERSLTLPWSYSSSGYRPFSTPNSHTSPSLSPSSTSTATTATATSSNAEMRRSTSLQPGAIPGQNSLRPPSFAGSEDESPGPSRAPSSHGLPWNSLSSRLSSATLPSKRKLQKVELLHLTEPCREMVSPDSVSISSGESVYVAQPVVTPIERLRRKDREVATALEEKQKLIEDILNMPHQEVDLAMAGIDQSHAQGPRTAAEILLSTLAQARALTALVNKSLKVSEEEAVRALASKRKGGTTGEINDGKSRILAKGEKLVEITSAINKQLTLLLTIVQENEKERENLRRDLCRSQEQVRSLLSGDSSSWSSALSPTSASTPLSPVSVTPTSVSPLPSPLTSKSSSPPFPPSDVAAERHTVFSSLSSVSR